MDIFGFFSKKRKAEEADDLKARLERLERLLTAVVDKQEAPQASPPPSEDPPLVTQEDAAEAAEAALKAFIEKSLVSGGLDNTRLGRLRARKHEQWTAAKGAPGFIL